MGALLVLWLLAAAHAYAVEAFAPAGVLRQLPGRARTGPAHVPARQLNMREEQPGSSLDFRRWSRQAPPQLKVLGAPAASAAAAATKPAAEGGTADDEVQKPLLLYTPGVEGLGISCEASQFPGLAADFDLRYLVIDSQDRSTFNTLVRECSAFLEQQLQGRPPGSRAVLVGESFGGLLALRVAAANPHLVEHAFVINPATCFLDTPWPRLGQVLVRAPRPAYTLASVATFFATIPDAEQVLDVAGELLDPRRRTPLAERPARLASRIGTLLRQISQVAANLPRDTLEWRLRQWMGRGADQTAPLLSTISVPVTVLAGTVDRLLPSLAEARRLEGVIPDCRVVELTGHGHAALFDQRTSLSRIIAAERERRGGGAAVAVAAAAAPTPQIVDTDQGEQQSQQQQQGEAGTDPVTAFVPPDAETVAMARSAIQGYKRSISPVFLSTQPDGMLVEGLSALPDKDPDRPLLFVGNHQYMAIDLSLIYDRLLEEKNILPRGLAHPAIFSGRAQPGPLGQLLRDAFDTFGAVPVSAKNFYKLLHSKESVLLFPGGAREAYHRRGEENQLFWPDKSEVIRMAVAANAIIIPFAAIGAFDSFNVILDNDEALQAPVIGPALRELQKSMPSVRGGEDIFVAPIALPSAPRRQYFVFGAPIDTRGISKRDRERCDALYGRLKQDIFQGIELLLRLRESDPYDDPGRRLAYEAVGGRRAPTFALEEANCLQQQIRH